MRLEDYEKKELDDVLGLYKKGEIDQVPESYLSDSFNMDYEEGEWRTRPGLIVAASLGYGGPIRRFATFNDPDIGPLTLILDNTGHFYTFSSRAGDTATSVKLTVASAVDFSAIKMLNKIFIACHDGNYGLVGVNLKVLILHTTDHTQDVYRDAGGAAPSAGSAIVAADGAAGLVNAGIYAIAVAYVTTTGFVTPPGPKIATVFTPTFYTAPGSKKISLSNIPTGPSGTAKRQILITKAGLDEYFFLPSTFGGLINDNTTTTATLDFDDTTDLVDSADYLFDLLETISAPLALQDYSARLCTAGERTYPSIVRVSRPGEPEAFSNVDGACFISQDDGFTMRNLLVVRGTLYAWKNLGVYSIRDNNDVPTTWPVNPIDQNVNVGVHGIAQFFDMAGIRMARDWTLLADRAGILLFDGIVRKPAITHNIDDLWQTNNWAYFHKIVLVVDEQKHKIYCSFPSGSATENDTLIMGDYHMCPGNIPETNTIKWSKWQFFPTGSFIRPTEIGMFGVPGIDTVPTLKIGSLDGTGKIWKLDPAATTDNNIAIESFFETALFSWETGSIHSFNAIQMRAIGSGVISIHAFGIDSVLSAACPSITLASAPGKEYLVRFNFNNIEKARFKFTTQGKMVISKVAIYGKPVFTMRPA